MRQEIIYIVANHTTGQHYHWTMSQLATAIATTTGIEYEILGTIE